MTDIFKKIKPGDIILIGRRGFVLSSTLIRFANFATSGTDYRLLTHAAMYIGDDSIIESIIAPTKGVVRRKFSENYLNNKYDIVVVRRKPHTKYNASEVVKYCISRENSVYDFKALIYFILIEITPPQLIFLISNPTINALLNNDNAYFCSELIAEALLMSGDYCFDRAPDRIKPIDFLNNSYCFQIVYEDKASEGWKRDFISIAYISILVMLVILLTLLTHSIINIIIHLFHLNL